MPAPPGPPGMPAPLCCCCILILLAIIPAMSPGLTPLAIGPGASGHPHRQPPDQKRARPDLDPRAAGPALHHGRHAGRHAPEASAWRPAASFRQPAESFRRCSSWWPRRASRRLPSSPCDFDGVPVFSASAAGAAAVSSAGAAFALGGAQARRRRRFCRPCVSGVAAGAGTSSGGGAESATV